MASYEDLMTWPKNHHAPTRILWINLGPEPGFLEEKIVDTETEFCWEAAEGRGLP